MKAGPPAGLRLMFHKPGGRGGRTIGTWASIMTIDGAGSRSRRTGRSPPGGPSPPPRPRWRASAATGPRPLSTPRTARAGSATAGPRDEQHRVHHLSARDDRRRATAAGWIEQVGDELPLLVGEGDREAHCPRSWPPSVTAQPSEPGDPNGRIRPQAIRSKGI